MICGDFLCTICCNYTMFLSRVSMLCMQNPILFKISVHLLVHLSKAAIMSKVMEIIVTLFWHSSTCIIPVFMPHRSYKILMAAALNILGGKKVVIFIRNRRLSRRGYEIGPWLPRSLIGSHR